MGCAASVVVVSSMAVGTSLMVEKTKKKEDTSQETFEDHGKTGQHELKARRKSSFTLKMVGVEFD
eukprot:768813-Hanusia_phi.AAC.9